MSTHAKACKCKGLGHVKVPHGDCTCGSGEGCSRHDYMWMQDTPCDEKAESRRDGMFIDRGNATNREPRRGGTRKQEAGKCLK
jgi:hypothetical protein